MFSAPLYFMIKKKLIIFDLDGTLVNAYPAIIRSFNYAMAKLGYPKQKDSVIRRAVGWGDQNLLKPFVAPGGLSKAVSFYRQHHKTALLEDSRLFPEARSLLEYLKNKGYKLAVASNRPEKFSRILIKHLKIDTYFDYVLCGDKLKRGKPHPEILNRIMRKLGIPIRQAMYIGDMTVDAQAGRRAGVDTFIVTTGSSTKSEIRKEKPYRIISSLKEVFKYL